MNQRTLVILPGWGGTRDTWRRFCDNVASDFNVVCLELPCFGSEPCPSEVWGIDEYVEFVKKKILSLPPYPDAEKANKRELIILGHSFGGQIATQLVARNPEICQALVLSGPAVFRRSHPIKNSLFWLLAKLGKMLLSLPGLKSMQPLARKILYKAADSPDYAKTAGMQREIFKKITHQAVVKSLPAIQVPTIVVAGARDTYVPWRDSQKVAAQIPHAEFHLIPDGCHGLHLTHIEKLKSILQSI